MLNEIQDMLINTLVEKLNSHGFNVNPDTLKKAVANSPQIIQEIQSILSASSSEDRSAKINALLSRISDKPTGS